MSVAALYVQKDGVYFGLPDVDPWDVERDARRYPGPWPVVAHPPCSRWCRLAPVIQKRWGHPIGSDDGCFSSALRVVEEFGGVLEHPASSYAWAAFRLMPPEKGRWSFDLIRQAWVAEVCQSAYGHKARKATWLYYVGSTPPRAGLERYSRDALVRERGSDLWEGLRRKKADAREGRSFEDADRFPRRPAEHRKRS